MDRLLKTTILFRLPDAAPAQTVVGQNDPAIDVGAVQAAVDRGGSVLLLGTFDFGEEGQVLLHKDTAISGEADASSRPLTTIIGGDWPFFAPIPANMPLAHAGPVISIESIHFRHPSGGAIRAPRRIRSVARPRGRNPGYPYCRRERAQRASRDRDGLSARSTGRQGRIGRLRSSGTSH
jgi:hypothetical protein